MAKVEIPHFFKDSVSRLTYPAEEGSHEPIPPIPTIAEQRLMVDLMQVSSTLLSTNKEPKDQVVAFDAAYSLFATTIMEIGGALTPGLVELDIPNMVFNFALQENWFTSVALHGEKSEGYELLSPRRYPINRILSRTFGVDSGATVGWFTRVIQASVARWKMKLIEAQIRPTDDSEVDHEATLRRYRDELSADFKRRVKDENGKDVSDYALYHARQHSMHKPQFYSWKRGELSADHPATISFERFLKGNQRPSPRPAPKSSKRSKA